MNSEQSNMKQNTPELVGRTWSDLIVLALNSKLFISIAAIVLLLFISGVLKIERNSNGISLKLDTELFTNDEKTQNLKLWDGKWKHESKGKKGSINGTLILIVDGKYIKGEAKMNYIGGATADNILYDIESSNQGKTLKGKWKNPQHDSKGRFEFNLDVKSQSFSGGYSTNVNEEPNGILYWNGEKIWK